jgi:hypothetical protein
MELNVSRIVVDRSVDGINFTELVSVLPKGSEGQGASYSAVDPYPYAGVNFYRLRIIDIDGSKSYSDIIKLVTSKKPLAVTKLYPNPVSDVLNLQLQSEKRQVVNAAVYDLSGKQLKLQVIELNNGFNEATIRLTDLAGGSYFIQLKSPDGSSAGTYKVVKN